MNVHDIGPCSLTDIKCLPKPISLTQQGNYLAGNVITVEPGLYFIPLQMKLAQENLDVSSMIDFSLVDSYMREIQGVRIEDNIVIGKAGQSPTILTNV